jgi:hypothetical protein
MLYLCVLCTKFCLGQFAIAKHHWSSLFANPSSVSYFLIHFLGNIFLSCIQYRLLIMFSTKFWNTAIIELQRNIVNDACLVFYSIMCNRNHGFTHFSLRRYFQARRLLYTKFYQGNRKKFITHSLPTLTVIFSSYSVFYFLKAMLINNHNILSM